MWRSAAIGALGVIRFRGLNDGLFVLAEGVVAANY